MNVLLNRIFCTKYLRARMNVKNMKNIFFDIKRLEKGKIIHARLVKAKQIWCKRKKKQFLKGK